MNVATLAYYPPSRIPTSEAFRQNIRRFKTKYPVILYSDTPDQDDVRRIENPERYAKAGKPFAISNFCWLKALQIAVQEKIDWLIYMEADCRVNGHEWDAHLMDEFSTFDKAACGGTPVCWHLNRGGRILTIRLIEYIAEYQSHAGIPMAMHGALGGLGRHPMQVQPCLYPNGAAAVYNVELMLKMFPDYMNSGSASQTTAWDMHIGYMLHNYFGDQLCDMVAPLVTVFSGYGDEILTERERQDWLSTGRVIASHQHKGDWQP